MKRLPLLQEEQPAQKHDIIVFKLVAVVDDRRTSMGMGGKYAATYTQEQVTVPPIPRSPLFAYQTLEVATNELRRIRNSNADNPLNASIALELWKARTSAEVPCPDRIPMPGVWYNGLVKHAGWGAGLEGCYAFFWQNVSYSLKHCIGKRSGLKLDPALIICCMDIILLEQCAIQEGDGTCL